MRLAESCYEILPTQGTISVAHKSDSEYEQSSEAVLAGQVCAQDLFGQVSI
ncbi:hypothetical protein [Aliikangiella sp. G2MR2-5]|uniref:hypothetical protein n=1 Tax=Aliikangiella sp. G2MR2-5 TaxID=2788943 RepID=UPI0018AC382A|nr:hypothetical protein [Aliikangiella sp. G2MR2-5]